MNALETLCAVVGSLVCAGGLSFGFILLVAKLASRK